MRKTIVGAVTLAAATGLASLGVAAIAQSAHGQSLCVAYGGVTYAHFGVATCFSTPGSGAAVGVGEVSTAGAFGPGGHAIAVGSPSVASTFGGVATTAGGSVVSFNGNDVSARCLTGTPTGTAVGAGNGGLGSPCNPNVVIP